MRKSEKDNKFKNETFLFLNGNKSDSGYIAIGCKKEIVYTAKNINLEKLNDFISIPDSWKFGYISYDVKNEFENLPSANLDGLEFPEIHFFIPQTLFKIEKDNISLIYGDNSLLPDVKEVFLENKVKKTNPITLTPRITEEEYLVKVQCVKENIQQGDTMGAMNMLPRGDMPVRVNPNKGMRGSENLNPVSPPPKEEISLSKVLLNPVFMKSALTKITPKTVQRDIQKTEERQDEAKAIKVAQMLQPKLGGLNRNVLPNMMRDEQVAAQSGGLIGMAMGGNFSGQVPGQGHGMQDNVYMPIVERQAGNQVATLAVSPDEYVVDAHTMSALGNGSADAGAKVMDNVVKNVREQAYGTQKQPNEINGLAALRPMIERV